MYFFTQWVNDQNTCIYFILYMYIFYSTSNALEVKYGKIHTQQMCALLQRSAWSRGRVLGGSSSLNNLQYVRGSHHDYDRWAKDGCKGWSYKDVLPYFIKSEDIQIPELQNSGKNIRFVHQNFFFFGSFWRIFGSISNFVCHCPFHNVGYLAKSSIKFV